MARGLARAGFDADLRYGELREGELARLLADRGALVEVKADDRSAETGNFFVELRQKGRLSGLMVTEAQWWAFRRGDDMWVLVATERLKELVKKAAAAGKVARGGDANNYDGVLVPVGWLLK